MKIDVFNKDKILKLWEITHNEPILSLYLDTDHKISDQEKKSKIIVKDLFKKLIEENNEDKKLIEKLKEYEEEILDYIDTNWRYLQNWTVFFIWSEHNHFEVVDLPKKINSEIYLWEKALIEPLIKYLDEFKKYLAVVMDTRKARVFLQYAWDIKEIEDLIDNFWEQIKQKIDIDWKDEKWVIARYINKLSDHIMQLKQKIWFDEILVFAPKKLENLIEKEVNKEFKKDLIKIITGNFTKLNINDIKNKIIESL